MNSSNNLYNKQRKLPPKLQLSSKRPEMFLPNFRTNKPSKIFMNLLFFT